MVVLTTILNRSLISDIDNTIKEWMCISLLLLIKNEELGAIMVGHTLRLARKGPKLLTR